MTILKARVYSIYWILLDFAPLYEKTLSIWYEVEIIFYFPFNTVRNLQKKT